MERVARLVASRWVVLAFVPLSGCLVGAQVNAHEHGSQRVTEEREYVRHPVDDDRSLSAGAYRGDDGRIPILQAHHLERATEVLAILDVHSEMGGESGAVDAMRQRAAAVGADAVLGAEFHHGEGGGEATHLSGVAVRFVSIQFPASE